MPGVPDYRDTPTPTPHRIPRALETGKLDPGWLPAAGAGSVTSAAFQGEVAARIAGDDALSNAISALALDDLVDVSAPAPVDGDALIWNSAQGQWVASAMAGGGSVTSADFVSLRSDVGRISVALSGAISAIAANSAQMTSADDALSVAINVVSNALSNEISVRTSAVNAVSNRLSTWRVDDLADVSAPTPTDAQVLMWRSTSAQWVASTPPAATVSVPGSAPQLIYNSAGTFGATSGLTWEITATKLNISGDLSVLGNIFAARTFVNDAEALSTLVVNPPSSAEGYFLINPHAYIHEQAQSVAQLTANVSAWDPVKGGNTLIVNSDASTREVQGILAPAITGRQFVLINNGSFDILIMHENGAASAANRIVTPDGGTFTLAPNEVVKLGYYATTLGDRWIIMSKSQAGGGSGSVTSADFVSLRSDVGRISVALSGAISSIAANSAQMTSADNAISAAAAAVSVRLDSTNTVVSNQGSAIAANSAQMTSADNAISAAAAAVSVRLNSTNTVVSNQGSAIVANSAQMTSADNAISNRLSTWTLDDLAGVSVPAPTDQQVLVFNSAAGQWLASTPAGGSGSVTSSELSHVASIASAAASNVVSLASDVGRISTLVAAGLVSAGPVKIVLAGIQTVSATAPISLSGFTFTVSATVAYSFEFGIIAASPISTAGLKLVLSTPSGGGNIIAQYYNANSPAAAAESVINGSNQTVAYVTVSSAGTARFVMIRGALKPSNSTTFALAVGNNVSGAGVGSAITIQAGSYAYLWRMG